VKLTLGELRRAINEVVQDSSGTRWGSRDELQRLIAMMDPDDVADKDWVDDESGEVVLEKGAKARSSTLHPQHAEDMDVIDAARDVERAAEMAQLDAEDAAYEEARLGERDRLLAEYDAAVREFAGNWTHFKSEMADVSPEDAAPDAAEGFFYAYPKWKQWARAAGIGRPEMKSTVQDFVYEAMTSGQAPD